MPPSPSTSVPAAAATPHHRRGFTLIEVMLTIALLAGVTGALWSAFSTGDRMTGATMAESRVMEEVQRWLEEVQNTRFPDVPGYDGKGFTVLGVDPDPAAAFQQAGTAPVIGRITVASVSYASALVTISAGWRAPHGPERYSVTYLHTNRGGR